VFSQANPSRASTASAADVSIKSSFASIATVVFEYLPCRSAMRQAAWERVRVTLGALADMARPLLTDSGLPHYGTAHSHRIRDGDAVHNSNGADAWHPAAVRHGR
jgi:hypothetical protein